MTIEELLAREEIKDLRIAYTVHFDRGDLDKLVDLFTEDAVCDFGGAFGTWEGRETIRENYAREMARVGGPHRSLHVVTNPWVEFDGPDSARATWYLNDLLTRQNPDGGMVTQGGEGNPLFCLGLYTDTCRKEGGRWKIARTHLTFLWPTSLAEAAAG